MTAVAYSYYIWKAEHEVMNITSLNNNSDNNNRGEGNKYVTVYINLNDHLHLNFYPFLRSHDRFNFSPLSKDSSTVKR